LGTSEADRAENAQVELFGQSGTRRGPELHQAALARATGFNEQGKWSEREDSNRRPHVPKTRVILEVIDFQ
jgi:hypothetical protein